LNFTKLFNKIELSEAHKMNTANSSQKFQPNLAQWSLQDEYCKFFTKFFNKI
jgi:hypothetical protein